MAVGDQDVLCREDDALKRLIAIGKEKRGIVELDVQKEWFGVVDHRCYFLVIIDMGH